MTMSKIIYYIIILISTIITCGCLSPQKQNYPLEIENVLLKAKNNRKELEKALDYFYKRDTQNKSY